MANFLEITDTNFNKKSTAAYDLLVNIAADRISFAIHDIQLNILLIRRYDFQTVDFDHQKENFKTVFFEDKLLSLPYRAVKIAVSAPFFTFIPHRLYQQEHEPDYLSHITEVPDVLKIHSNPLPKVSIQNVFALEEQFLNSIRSYFSNGQIYHALTPIVNGYYQLSENKTGTQVFVNIHQNHLQLILFDNKNLIFANQFQYFSKQDFIYYVLLIYEQFKLDPEMTALMISGYILEKSDLYTILYQYIRHISFVPAPSFFHFSEPFQGADLHFYFDLFCLKLCE